MANRSLSRLWELCLRRLAFFLLAAAVGLGQGCGPAPAGPGATRRFIEEDPEELFDPASLYERRRVFAWGFSSHEDVAAWETAGIDELRPENGALTLRSSIPNLELQRPVDFAAGEVDAIEVRVQGLIAGRVAVEWAGAGQGLAPERRIILRSPNPAPGAVQLFHFKLAGHPEWRGRIIRLRLRLAVPPQLQVALHDVQGFSEALLPERLARAASRSWKVDLDDEVRNALPAVPGREIRRQLTIPAGGRLRFAWGTPREIRVPVHFQVALAQPGAPPRILYGARSQPGAGAWQEAEVDLRTWADERVELILSATAPGSLDLRHGFPAWANPEVLGGPRGGPPPNIILISVDTLRADRLSLYGYSRPTTPHLDAWARRSGVTFREAVAASPWTLPSHTSLFTGLDAVRHGVNHSAPAPTSLATLAEQLRRSGYRTLAITGGGFLRPEMGLVQGFDVYRYWGNRSRAETELAAGIDQALRWIGRYRDRPFFLFFHTYEVHSPYLARQPYLRHLTGRTDPDRSLSVIEHQVDSAPGEPTVFALGVEGGPPEGDPPSASETVRLASDLYDSGLAYADAGLARLLERVQGPDLAGRTVVVLTSDHGEMLGEHDLVSHTSLYDENLLVPLVVATADGRGAGHEVGDQVRQVDVMPTLLSLAGAAVPAGIDGVSLVPLLRKERLQLPAEAWSYAARDNRGLALRVRGRLKYVFNNTAWPPFGGRESLFRLDRDPGELHDAAPDAAELEALRRRSRQVLESAASGLRVRLESSGGATVRGTLSGPAIQADRVKSWDLACPCLELRPEGGAARFTVPAGQRFTLQLETVEGEELSLAVRAGEQGLGFGTTFRLRDLRGPESIVLEDGRWRRTAGNGGKAAARISIWWHHDVPARPILPVAKQLLLEDLRALGYAR